MRAEYVTLKKNDSQFLSYLEGTFSSEHIALPTQNMNVNTASEEVTFQIYPKSAINKPHFFMLLFKLFRMEWLSLSMGPVLATLCYLIVNGHEINILNSGLSIFAVLLFHSAVFAINDYKDHLRGVDRLTLNGGSQVIQKGWLSARIVRKIGLSFFTLGSFIGVYLIAQQPFFLIAVAICTAVAVLGYSFYGQGLKYLGFGELVAFFCFGPLLTYGFSRATSQVHNFDIIALGIGFGFLAAISLQSRQLENIMSDAQAGVGSLAVRLGFDRCKFWLQFQIIFSALILGLTMLLLNPSQLALFLILPYSYFIFRLYQNIDGAGSSLSSQMNDLRLQVSDLHVVYSTVVVISFWLIRI